MIRKPQPSVRERVRWMHDRLMETYGPQSWWPADTAFEVILGAYLTQNTSWKAVERSLANLREAGALDIPGIRRLSSEDLQGLIRPSGFYTRKAPAIKAFVAMLDTDFGGSLDVLAAAPTSTLRERLLTLPGVGPETADAILLYGLHHAVPVADEYLRRIVARHRLLDEEPRRDRGGYESLVQITTDAFQSDLPEARAQIYNEFHALTVAVGKAHCGKVARCTGCPLESDLRHVPVRSRP